MTEAGQYGRRSLILSFGASVIFLLAFALGNYYRLAEGEFVPFAPSVLAYLFQWMAYILLAFANLVFPAFIRFFLAGKPLSASHALPLAFFNYATIMLIYALPYELFIGHVQNIGLLLIARAFRILGAILVLVAGYMILRTPDEQESLNIAPPIDNTTKCLLVLGDFIERTKRRTNAQYDVERLWQLVYTYLKNGKRIDEAINVRRTSCNEIVLNAVGSFAYRLLASGDYHESKGKLSPQGEYIREIWKIAAGELIQHSRNTQADMERGLMALEAAVAEKGG